MKNSLCFLAALSGLFLAGAGTGPAATVVSEIGGAVVLTCPGLSDTVVSVPLARPALFIGAGSGAGEGKIALQGATLSEGQLATLVTTPSYVHVCSGALEGWIFRLSGSTAEAITVENRGADLAALAQDRLEVVPYWTLNTLFPAGEGLTAASGTAGRTEILLPPARGQGTNHGPVAVASYVAEAGEWQTAEGASANHLLLPPGSCFTVRNTGPEATTLSNVGTVWQTKQIVPLPTSPAAAQDCYVALQNAVPLSLQDSGLATGEAFVASQGFASRDQLFVYSPSLVQLRKAPSEVYTLVGGLWRRAGSTDDAGADVVFTPGTGVLIRKAPAPEGSAALWTVPALAP